MKYISTRNHNLYKSLSEAITSGLVNDGGLFMPDVMPKIDFSEFSTINSYPEFSSKILSEFFMGDELHQALPEICDSALNFPVPLEKINDNTFELELFHGPTLSFKDVGARFLSECLDRLSPHRKTTIMVATSGDTGSAVASALHGKSNINVIILYPKGQISKRQEHQITCWGSNVIALAVNGNFDDCQALVKSAFQNPFWQQHFSLGSANSINIGRLLPQITYYAYSSMQFYQKYNVMPGFIIPTGNLGNATAGYFAKLMGFPIREIVLSTNANSTISEYLQSGKYQPRASVSTLANAMDVGNPSNFERLLHLYPDFDTLKKNVKAFSVSDEEIQQSIIDIYKQNKKIICPHTATAFFARKKLSDQPFIIVATAHPCKFENIIEPLIHEKLSTPYQLQILLDKPVQVHEVENNLDAIQKKVGQFM